MARGWRWGRLRLRERRRGRVIYLETRGSASYAKVRFFKPSRGVVMDKKVISLLKTQAFIDGAWVGEGRLPVTDKATGEEIARVPAMGAVETNLAIEAAHRAFPGWSKRLAKDRSKI